MTKIKENSIILVDGSSYLYRAYHALPFLTNNMGEPIGVMYGVLNMLKSLLVKYSPSYMAVIFDTKGKTFRDKLFKNYKSHRPCMPIDLINQITPLYEMIKGMGIPLLAINGIEADDIIGTIAIEASKDNFDVLISTCDKDIAQLVSPKIRIINTMSNIIFGPEEVKLKFGIPPELIVDYLALKGDISDNIPGIPGIGAKTAIVLLKNLGNLKVIYQKLDVINNLKFRGSKTLATKLNHYRELAFLSYNLAMIKTNIPLDLSYDKLTIKEPDIKILTLLFHRYKLYRYLDDLKLGRWLKNYKNNIKLTSPAPTTANLRNLKLSDKISLKNNYHIIYDMVMFKQWIKVIHSTDSFAFDIKTDVLDIVNANLLGLCFTIKLNETVYLPIEHKYLRPNQLDYKVVITAIKKIFEDPSIIKISHNIKFNYGVLKRYNIELTGIMFDTMLESYVLNSVAGRHDIVSISERFLKYKTKTFNNIYCKKHNQITSNDMTLEQVALCATENVNLILHLHQILWPCIEQTPELKKIFQEIEMPLAIVLSSIEQVGVLIDKNVLVTYSVELTKNIKLIEQEAHKLAEKSFNLSSTKQLRLILYSKQNLPVLKKTPSGLPSTNEEVLTKLALSYPLPRLILKYRNLFKLKSTYTDKLSQMINLSSKRLHTSYHQDITSTGRLSSSNPNLQNIPVRNNEGRRIRQAFIAPSGMFILSADYSQIELRIMAHLSHEPEFINAFINDKDIHCSTAANIFGIPIDKVTQNQRRSAKIINFGLIYGMSSFGLARQLSISRLEAQKYIDLYFKQHPNILKYIKYIRKQAKDQGYIKTLDGRRLYIPNIQSSNNIRKKSAERAAINAPVQGTAADIIKRAMIKVNKWLYNEWLPVRMIMQVHDELVFEVKKDIVNNVKEHIKALMENCFTLDVPLRVNIGIGENWDQAH